MIASYSLRHLLKHLHKKLIMSNF